MTTLDAAFAGAAASDLRCEGGQVRFAAPLDDSPQSMWWHFALETPEPVTVTCVWERTNEVLGHPGLAKAVPVYHDGARWRRVPSRTCRYCADSHELRFRVPCRAGRTEVAYCYPYTWEQIDALLAELTAGGEATVRQVGTSAHGRPFRLLEFGHGDRQVWAGARHHSGEVCGSYVLEGFAREALRRPALLAAATFHVAAAMDGDGVAEGLYGKDRAPRDYNRDYCSPPSRPEVAALMAAAQAAGADVYLDLHGPAPGDGTFLVPVKEPFASLQHWDAVWRLGSYLEALAPASCPCRMADLHRDSLNWCSENTMQNSTDYFQRTFDALSLTLETAYHRSHDGRLVTPRGWMALGRALAQALGAALGVLPTPDVSTLERPRALVPRLQHWRCVHLPVQVDLAEQAGRLSIGGHGGNSYCWLMSRDALPAVDGRTVVFCRLRGQIESLTLTAKGWDTAAGLPTGTWEGSELHLRAAGGWQELALPHAQGTCLLMVRLRGLEGTLELCRTPPG